LPPPVFDRGAPEGSRPERVEWSVREDVLRRERSVEIDHGGERGLAGVADSRDRYRGRIGVRWDEPGRCEATGEAWLELGWPEAKVRAASRCTLRSDDTTWSLAIEFEVFDGEERIAERRWERTVARDLQ
jgi:hypothetical protein